MSAKTTETATDGELWDLIRAGSVAAFEVLVRRHQGVIAAVAYSVCGNLSLSEDVAQETFWAAWRERESAAPPVRHLPWLCGVARNLGRNAARRAGRSAESGVTLDAVAEPATATPGPPEAALAREEEALVWENLARIPENYREPLILFYRDGQSVAGVARALDLTEDAAKQRLSRGRALLRERLIGVVEAGLLRSRPGRGFTRAVMAGVGAASAGAKTTSAAGVAGAVAKAGLGAGLTAGVLGPLIGLGGGWLGTWVPAQLAATTRERDLILRVGRRILLVSVGWTVGIFGLVRLFGGQKVYLVAFLGWMLGFQAYIALETCGLVGASRRLRQTLGPDAKPNDSALRRRVASLALHRRGRVYQSRARLFGWPLIDCNVSDPISPTGEPIRLDYRTGSKVARGWIAVGDHAQGLLVAVGSTAIAPVALGLDRAVGLVCFGSIAVGGVAVGAVAVGGLAFGGIGLGGLGLGGLALGVWAGGGLAVAWDVAVGGLALARHAALGGAAFAFDLALGGGGQAPHFNDHEAKIALLAHPLKSGLDWCLDHRFGLSAGFVAVVLLMPWLILALKFRRDPTNSGANPTNSQPEDGV